MLTQENCPECERLKKLLEIPLRGKYTHLVESVKREENEELFRELTAKHNLKTVPALVSEDGKVHTNMAVTRVQDFLEGRMPLGE